MAANIKNLLDRFEAGEQVDFEGRSISAIDLSQRIQNAAENSRSGTAITLLNAKVSGDLNLNGVGKRGRPITLQIISCDIDGGLRSRSSHWDMLLIAKSHLKFVDLPKSELNELLIELSQVEGVLEARSLNVSGTVSLSGSTFRAQSDGYAIQLNEARIGRSIRATNCEIAGALMLRGVRIDGALKLGGSIVGKANVNGLSALDISDASVSGAIELCVNDGRSFEAIGAVKLTNSKIGVLAILGANLNGLGGPSIIADSLQVDESVLMGAAEGRDLNVKGIIRFLLTKIGGQFQLTNAIIESNEPRCLLLNNSKIGADLLIGQSDAGVEFRGAMTADSIKCGGKIILSEIIADATNFDEGSAISIREASVHGGVIIQELTLTGCLNIDHSKIGGLSIHNMKSKRAKPSPDLSGLPENYGHEDDALLSVLYATIEADVFFDELIFEGGDIRMMGVSVKGLTRMTRVHVTGPAKHALVFQDARLNGGFMISGTTALPCQLEGLVNFMGAEIGSSMTLSDVVIGISNGLKQADLAIDSANIASDVILHRIDVYGKISVSSAVINGNLRLEGARLYRPGEAALYANGASIGGQLNFAAADPLSQNPRKSALDGDVFLDGIRVGNVRWAGLKLAKKSNFHATDMVIDRSLEALSLEADADCWLDLSGSKASSLIDRLGDTEDGWGAGNVKLGLDSFRYDRLISATGRTSSHPDHIREWRVKWLQRRNDKSSTQAARQLARILHEQGLHEGSRLILMDAFTEDGNQASTNGLVALQWLFGVCFGHGFSGGRAILTILVIWLFGTIGVLGLQSGGFLVKSEGDNLSCFHTIDPSLYAADVLLPVIDLGQESKCEIGYSTEPKIVQSQSTTTFFGKQYRIFGTLEVIQYLLVFYQILGWVAFSLALATWSGLFKRSGRGA